MIKREIKLNKYYIINGRKVLVVANVSEPKGITVDYPYLLVKGVYGGFFKEYIRNISNIKEV